MGLREYERKRDFKLTPEPSGRGCKTAKAPAKRSTSAKLMFVVQKHAASRLHYDVRLEHDGVLLSWAVPKGPSLDPADKRLAVQVEDHPLDYGDFEGTIPQGQYGGGSVIVWDRGRWRPVGDPTEGLRRGTLEFELEGKKLKGSWALVRMHDRTGSDKNWLLIKHKDEFVRPGSSITEEQPESAKSGRLIEEIGARHKVWNSDRAEGKAKAAKKKNRAKPTVAGRPRSSVLRARKGDPGTAARKSVSPRAVAEALGAARRAPLSHFVEPQLATLDSSAPTGEGWLHEVKYDGYRMGARLSGGRVTWISRNGLDWTSRFEALSSAIAALPATEALIDGEVVVLGQDGVSRFQDLQQSLGESHGSNTTYFAFDLIHLDGLDLRRCTLVDRKKVLRALFASVTRKSPVRYSDHIVGGGPEFIVEACRNGLEGIISKRVAGSYSSGRTRDWIKVKCGLRQEFVVAGFTQPAGSRVGLGSLVLGVHERGTFRHAGRVGTGFDRARLLELRKQLEALKSDESPFDKPVDAAARRGVTWVRPRMVVEVAFTGWTTDGLLRHPSFQGMREDKRAEDVVKELPTSHRRDGAAQSARKSAAKKRGGR